MKVTKNEVDALNATLLLTVEKEDYASDVEKTLKDYRRKANIPGFRPGKVPMGMIKKMYGTSVLVEEINKKVSQELYNYVYTEKLDILGEPLPSKQEQKTVNWDKDETFEFAFDIAVAPKFEVKLSKRDKLNRFDINPGDELIGKYLENYQKQFGSHIQKDEVGIDDMLKGTFTEEIEGGLVKENGTFLVNTLKTKKAQNFFIGKKQGSTVIFKVKEVFKNKTDLKSMLGIDDDKLENLAEQLSFTIESISQFKDADLDQSLFDKVFGENKVKSEEEFRTKIIEQVKENLEKDSDYKFHVDVKEKLTKKIDFELPDEFLKRWLIISNKEITQERLDKEYPLFQEDMKWQLIKGKIVKDNSIEVSEEELMETAKEFTRAQFQMYGSMNIPDEYIDNFAKEVLGKEEERQRIVERAIENKVVEFVKETVKVEDKEIAYDDFNKLLQK